MGYCTGNDHPGYQSPQSNWGVDLGGDFVVVLVLAGEAVLDSGMALEIITMEVSQMYLKKP